MVKMGEPPPAPIGGAGLERRLLASLLHEPESGFEAAAPADWFGREVGCLRRRPREGTSLGKDAYSMTFSTRVRMSVLVLGLMGVSGALRAQEHRDLDMQTIPSPLELVRDVQNAGKVLFVMADTNHDGQISQQEAIDSNNLVVGGFFFRADADGNGAVTQEEARAVMDKYLNQNPWMRYVVQSLQSQTQGKQTRQNPAGGSRPDPFQGFEALIDTNNDKQIQASELRQAVQTFTQSFFAAADTNRDGQMSPAEINAAVAGAVRSLAQTEFQQADTDQNGQLSRSEYDKAIIEPANVVFQILDLNHDGQLSPQEAQAVERAVVHQFRMMHVAEAPNSPTNLIEQGKLPGEAAPVPSFTAPNVRPSGNSNPAPGAPRPVAPPQPR
jgi:Ca2+-binding EF-hand superfamily protein